ncbi:23324_t:CDS:2, partial [Gigaspora margarita]
MIMLFNILALNHQPPLVQTRWRVSKNPIIKRDIFEIFDLGTFWTNLTTIAEILYPYYKILNILQSDNARLIYVIHGFAYLVQLWNNNTNQQLAEKVLTQLEKSSQSESRNDLQKLANQNKA